MLSLKTDTSKNNNELLFYYLLDFLLSNVKITNSNNAGK